MARMPHPARPGEVPAPIEMGRTYTIVPPAEDPTCLTSDCALHTDGLFNPWALYAGKKVTVVETGLEYAGHDAVRVTTGPVDWHPRVAVRLTDEQMQALGVLPGQASTSYLMLGQVWAVNTDVPAAFTDPDLDDLPWGFMSPVEMPQQRTEVIPAMCLQSRTVDPEEKRRVDRLRRIARGQGLRLRKLRGHLGPDEPGPYLLEDSGTPSFPWGRRGRSLDDVEAELLAKQESRA